MDFDTPGNRLDADVFTGSMQQLLILHKGEPILAEFLIGTNNMITKKIIKEDISFTSKSACCICFNVGPYVPVILEAISTTSTPVSLYFCIKVSESASSFKVT